MWETIKENNWSIEIRFNHTIDRWEAVLFDEIGDEVTLGRGRYPEWTLAAVETMYEAQLKERIAR